jgi:MFS family permease
VAAIGLRENLPQFGLLVALNILVGAMVGQERTVVPLIATESFGLPVGIAATTFLVSFGLAKAFGNLAAGRLADERGRRPVLILGWLLMAPVPLALAYADAWAWVVAANALLGAGQGLAWSMTVTMKIDIAGASRRGLAAGANEAAGYLGVAVAAFLTGAIAERAGLRPGPFILGAIVAVAGIALSAGFVRETRHHAERESVSGESPNVPEARPDRLVTVAAQAGLVTNLNDAVAWVLFPIVFATAGLSLTSIGVLVAVYPAVWGAGQLVTGPLSDRWGRRRFVVAGMALQALGLSIVAAGTRLSAWATGAALLGAGTAMVYPVLLAAVSDVVPPGERAARLGVYRFWRDAGLAIGGVLAGVVAGATGPRTAVALTAALTAASGVASASWLRETRPRRADAASTPV